MDDGALPILRPNDPEFVYVNAAFIALAHPPSRRILELLAVAPRDGLEIRAHVVGEPTLVDQVLQQLEQVGFITKEGTCWELGGPAVERIKNWVALLG